MTIAHRIGLLVLAWVLYANGVAGIFHCLTAKQMCLQDDACAKLLDIVTQTCRDTYNGTVCRALSLDYCRKSLKAVWSHAIFGGACVCADDAIDPDCNKLRNYLSDHPCLKHPPTKPDVGEEYPTCTFALNLCNINHKCKKIFDSFRRMCRVKDDECRMHNLVKCKNAWTDLQLSPIYGCLCHEDGDLDKCARFYRLINRNPCVEKLDNWVPTYWIPTDNSQPESNENMWPFTHDPLVWTDHAALPHTVTALVSDPEESSTLSFPGGELEEPPMINKSEDPWVHSPFLSPLHGELLGLYATYTHSNEITNGVGTRDPVPTSGVKIKSTCQQAYSFCELDKSCQVLLGNMIHNCEPELTPCNRTECMIAVQNYYQLANPSTIRAVAFCICKFNDEECLTLQRRLHPPCSQRFEVDIPSCLDVVNQCRDDPKCRSGMNKFAEACAIHHKTAQCEGPLENCRRAIIDILGSRLRTNCACSGLNFAQLYHCIEWQRMIWLNPCVVQAQKDYHENRLTIPSSPSPPTKPPNWPIKIITKNWSTTSTATSTSWDDSFENEATVSNDGRTSPDNTEFCLISSGGNSKGVPVPINDIRRIYSQDNSRCSIVCSCSADKIQKCTHIPECVENFSCHSDLAVYTHDSPAYVANRGHCLCYSGKFICNRPPKDKYTLSPGVYFFLGYSKKDEENLNKHVNVTIADAVRYIQRMADNLWPPSCKLVQSSQIEENLILQAYMEEFAEQRQNNSVTQEMVQKEEKTCATALRNISLLFDKADPFVLQHVALSMIKRTSVEVSKEVGNGIGILVLPQSHVTLAALVFLMWAWRHCIGPTDSPT